MLTENYHRFIKEKAILPLFFISLLGLGTLLYGDYPVAYDETLCRDRGRLGWGYVTEGKPGLLSYVYRYHSTLFEIPAYGLEKVLGFSGSNAMLFRHFLIFLSFYVGVALFFTLCKRHYNSWGAGLVCCLLLVLSPRIFGSAFYNSKDIPFMTVSIAGLLTLFWLLERVDSKRILAHSLVTAAMIDLRLMALVMPVLTVLSVSLTANSPRLKNRLLLCTLYLISTSAFVILMWPLLWTDPAGHFLEALTLMSHYPPKDFQLYNGVHYNTNDFPWHYIPVWITITTPLTYTIGFLAFVLPFIVGAVINLKRVLIQRKKIRETILLAWITVPIIAWIVLGSTTYSTWRHFFYIYPAFVLLTFQGLENIIRGGRVLTGDASYALIIVMAVLSADLWTTANFMVRNHPYEQFYFNRLAGENMSVIQKMYTITYWRVANKDALEYVLSHDNRGSIPVYFNLKQSVPLNVQLIGKDADRIKVVDNVINSDYSVIEVSDMFEQYCRTKGFMEVHSLEIDGVSVMKVYHRCDQNRSICPQKKSCVRDSLP